MGLHTEEQLQAKREGIDIATDTFVEQYYEGKFEDNKEFLYHQIENLYSLVRELKQG